MRTDILAASRVAGFSDLTRAGITIGDSAAPIKVLVFSDLECPVCRRFHQRLMEEEARFGKEVAVVFVHFPLAMHRFARQAAQAAECAERQGRFGEFVNQVYENQDSIGLKSWNRFAHDAGIDDTISFGRCASSRVPDPRIQRGVDIGTKLHVEGTPTVIINGWRFNNPPFDSLASVFRNVIRGQPPLGTAAHVSGY